MKLLSYSISDHLAHTGEMVFDNIRKLREYNSLRHSKMSHKEILDDIRQGAESFMSEFSCCVAEKQAAYDAGKKK